MTPEVGSKGTQTINSMSVLALPWVFSQSHPLSTREVISEAKRRGLALTAASLRELYRRGDLAPVVGITTRRVTQRTQIADVPGPRGTYQGELRRALNEGRVRDPGSEPFRPRLRFDERRISDSPGWWNGLLYSRWQLISVPHLRKRLTFARYVGPREHRRLVLPELDEWSGPYVEQERRWALVLTALEARYFPTIDSEWLQLTNVEAEQWQEYRLRFDAGAIAQAVAVSIDDVCRRAEQLLSRAKDIDPTGDWGDLIRRAPRRAWKTLKGDALVALDYRMAAEMLLQFRDDLDPNAEKPGSAASRTCWHPEDERLSAMRREPIDVTLAHLGVSPHPGVVLAVEGETEELLVPRVFDHLGLRRTPDLVRILCMRGGDRDLTLVAAATVAPILGERRSDGYDMIRPPTRLVIAVDRDAGWDTDAKVASRRNLILREVQKVVEAQGAEPSPEDLASLVEIERWPARCFEFAHFSPAELAAAMAAIHPTCGGLSTTELIARIVAVRDANKDIKAVWDADWIPKPTKPALAEALWPVLKEKIDAAIRDAAVEVPPVADIVQHAYNLAQQSTYGTYVMSAADMSGDE